MDHLKYLVAPIDYPEFFGHVYQHDILKKALARCENGVLYRYPVKDKFFFVWESSINKIVTNLSDYNTTFDKRTGETYTYGLSTADDVTWCPLGPEILDLEISVNGCPKVGGKNCRFCYKNNTDAAPTNMSFETFKKIIDSFPRNLISVAFGITGTQTNPDFPKMLEYCRSVGIIPNYTLSGADLTDEIIEATGKYCGAVAISCYEGNKELAYNTIDRIHKKAPNVHINMHLVLSKGTLDHVMDVLNDLKKVKPVDRSVQLGKYKINATYKVPQDERLEHLRSVVFLRIKPAGRAATLDTEVSYDIFDKVIKACDEGKINYGFDSCSAKDVETVLLKNGKGDASLYCQSCESGTQSAYIACSGEYWHCSFAERDPRINKINALDYDCVTDWWTSDELMKVRENFSKFNGQCPLFKLGVN